MFDDVKNRLSRLEQANDTSNGVFAICRDSNEPPSENEIMLRKNHPDATFIILEMPSNTECKVKI